MISISPEGDVTTFGVAPLYALLGEHILGISWGATTTVWDAGTTSSPDPDASGATTYAERPNSDPAGWSVSADRLGVWFASGLWVLTFSNISGDLTFESDEFIAFSEDDLGFFDIHGIVDSDGRPKFQADLTNNESGAGRLYSVDSGLELIATWNTLDGNPFQFGGVAYDGVVVTDLPPDT